MLYVNDKLSRWCHLFMTKNRRECHKLAIYLLGVKKENEFMNEIDMSCSDDEYICLL